MSDLVGNPEDQFSHNEAKIKDIILITTLKVQHIAMITLKFEEKNGFTVTITVRHLS